MQTTRTPYSISFMATVLLLLLFACHSTVANAAVALGATRVIYPANQKQVLLPVTNNDPASVYLIFLGLCLGLTTYSALSADSVIKISGRVLDYGCTVSSDSLNFTVDLQKNSARQFPTTGSTSPAVPFQITLSECSKGTTGVRVAFNGIEDAENNTLLKLDEGSNTASGLGIEILDGNMRPVKLNDLHAGMQWIPLVPEQNNILPYSARLKSTQKSVNPGLVRASATFTLEFQ